MTYDDDDPGKLLRQDVVEPGVARGPKDGLMGHAFVELKLTKLLG